MTVTVGSLCTGIAGLDLGVTMAYGANTRHAWYAEYDPEASKILAERIPGVPNLGDITAIDWATLPRVDVLCAGFPCQPVSAAGRQKAKDDHRWLWPHVLDAITVLRPQEVILENVRNLISIQKGAVFAEILDGLRAAGYAVRWTVAGACAIGGCHHRHRVFIVARYAWQLQAPAAERVLITECGARRGKARALLPTPTAARYGYNQGGASAGGPVRYGLDNVHELLPTPGGYDGSRGGPQDPEKRKAGNHSVCLQDAVHGLTAGVLELGAAGVLLPSPTASDGARGPNPPAWPADNLTTAVDRLDASTDRLDASTDASTDGRLLPTPRATDTGTPGRRGGAGFRPPLSQAIADEQDLLPTPRARDIHGGDYDPARQQARREHSQLGGPNLPDVVQQHLLPTPAARDHKGASGDLNARQAGGRFHGGNTLPDAVVNPLVDGNLLPAEQGLLPTPRASDQDKGSPNQHGSRGDLMLPAAVIGDRYGRYAAAVALWATVSGRPAPEPTMRNSRGQWRLSPALPEWMMGYPQGWITDLVGRGAALRAAGNGVVSQVVAAVYPHLVSGWGFLQGGQTCPDDLGRPGREPAAHPDTPAGAAATAGGSRRVTAARPEQLTLIG